ncbi:tetratricopeptide repeat protein [Kangiella koreensis]|uniref:tetratricopeptide repeat protein n=1 Tax=Kangiella koreensis TaxID=261964 RepID=UPI001E3BD158|nr:tetratricopeptide repeat protein [Kangiella koreensis]
MDEVQHLLSSDPKAGSQYIADLELSKEQFNESQSSRFALYKSHSLLMAGDYQQATALLNNLLETNQSPDVKAQAYSMLAVIFASNSEFMNAFVNIEKARLMLNDLTDSRAIKTVLANAATIYTEVGFVDKAYEYSNSYLKEVSKAGLEKELCYAYFNSGNIEVQLQSYAKAKDYFIEASKNCKSSGQDLFFLLVSQELASINITGKNTKDSLKELELIQDKFRAIDWDIGEVNGLIKIADILLKLKKNEEAVKYAEKAFAAETTDNYFPHKKEATRILATAYSNLGNNDKAIEYYQLYIDTERQIQLQLKQRKMAYFIAMQSME